MEKDKVEDFYPFRRVSAMSDGEAEAFNIRRLAVNGSEILEGEGEVGLGNGITPVPEHLHSCSP